MALFHLTNSKGIDTEAMDYNKLVNYRNKNIYLKRGLIFLKLTFDSIKEAKIRCIVIALLTAYMKK